MCAETRTGPKSASWMRFCGDAASASLCAKTPMSAQRHPCPVAHWGSAQTRPARLIKVRMPGAAIPQKMKLSQGMPQPGEGSPEIPTT